MKNIIKIQVKGLSTERFINICRHHQIYFFDITNISDGFTAKLNAKDFLKLKPTVKATGVRIKILAKNGPYFTYRANRNRFALIVGIIIFIATIYTLSKHIWKIEFNGNRFYSEETMLEFLEENQITLGTKSSNINEENLETLIRKEFEEIIWVSVSVNGTRLRIDLKENDTTALSQNNSSPRDIIASKDGTIATIYVRTGTALVKPGDSVKAGDVLVASKVSCTNESMEEKEIIYTVADADILIETTNEYYDSIDRNYTERIYTGNVLEQTVLRVGTKLIETPILKCKYEHYDVVVDYASPFGKQYEYCYRYYREYEIIEKNYTDSQISTLLEENLLKYINKLEENSIQTLEKSVKIDIMGFKGEASGIIRQLEPAINYQDPIIIEEIIEEK